MIFIQGGGVHKGDFRVAKLRQYIDTHDILVLTSFAEAITKLVEVDYNVTLEHAESLSSKTSNLLFVSTGRNTINCDKIMTSA